MVSLTTIYGSAAALGTVAAFLAAYVGHTIYPIQTGGSVASVIETVKQKAAEVVNTVTKPAVQPLNTDVTPLEPPVEETPLPSVDLSPQNNPFQPPAEQVVS
jgi:hypothetical protein